MPDFLDRCLLETDAPFLTPIPKRGKINEPGNIADIATWLSRKLGVSETIVAEKTTENARKIFNLPDSISE
jgi:TatD DNase family protein